MRTLVAILMAVAVFVGLYLTGVTLGWYGRKPDAGFPTAKAVPAEDLAARSASERGAAEAIGARTDKQVLFGDLHVHSTFSTDAFLFSLPLIGGEGVHPVGDACDFARFCSALDFWSINDHAEALTSRKWEETKETIRRCNAVSGEGPPDVIAFLGWEWTQVGRSAEEHWGHKNVVLRDLENERVPTRPINSGGFTRGVLGDVPLSLRLGPLLLDPANRQRYYDFDAFARELADAPVCETGVDTRKLPRDCMESAETPGELFEKLSQWGHESLVIPHGTTWGFYTPANASWDHQLSAAQHDPERQTLIEVYSGHGNSEEFRSFEPVATSADGALACPVPTPDYLPSCWRAGELIRARCLAEGEDELVCDERAAQARAYYIGGGAAGRLAVPGASAAEWLDSGQCRDCFLPAFNYRPKNSVQYIEALTNFAEPSGPRRFRFGFIASSDVHSARPGTGYKEFARSEMADQSGAPREDWANSVRGEQARPSSVPQPVDFAKLPPGNALQLAEFERQSSFWLTGGLVAVHANERTRDGVWGALRRKETYATSGERMLLWFDLMNPPGEQGPLPMGSEVALRWAPRFEVRAIGAFEQKPGCPDYSMNAQSPARLEYLCKGECYNPSDVRKQIARIEIVRIRPQLAAGEPVAPLIEDPWRSFECAPDPNGCTARFDDPEFGTNARDTVYYARAVEAATPAVNAGALRCEKDVDGNCVKVDPCWGDYRTAADDDCLVPAEERAWSSPIYVDWSPNQEPETELSDPGALEEN